MTSHVCEKRPGFKHGDDPWVEGTVTGCPYHGHSGAKQLGFRPSKSDRAKADRAAGNLGTHRGDYISGN